MDPFEVRMKFTSLLSNLTASTNSSTKTAHFALKYKSQDEDLHSCIIENLEQSVAASNGSHSHTTTNSNGTTSSTNLVTTTIEPSPRTTSTSTNPRSAPAARNSSAVNSRANMMYFLEHFCDMALKEDGGGHPPYVDFVRRDIHKIVDCVAAGGVNVKVVRKVVGEWGDRGILEGEVVRGIEEGLRVRERDRGLFLDGAAIATTASQQSIRGRTNGDGQGGGTGGTGNVDGEDVAMTMDDMSKDDGTRNNGTTQLDVNNRGSAPGATTTTTTTTAAAKDMKTSGGGGGVSKSDRKAIEQRIEEDRERNKRLREGVWAVVSGEDEAELDKMWDQVSDVSEEDYVLAREEADERRQFARYHQSLLGR